MASTTWTPAPGRHKVNIGTSLTRALKARKGNAPPPKQNKLPDRDFYALRYNFKPSSIDPTKSGNMEVKRNKDNPNSSIIVEHPAQPSGSHVYKGREDPAKEWACVLIFDEETGTYTLEKIDSFVALEHVEKRAESLTQAAPSPLPSASERTPRGVVEEQDPGVDSDFAEILPEELVVRQSKQDVDSEEDIPIQQTVSSRPPPPPPGPSRPSKPMPTKARPKPAVESLPAKPKPPAPAPSNKPAASPNKPKKAPKRSTPEFSDGEEKVVDFAPAKSKRARPSAPAPPPAPQPAITKPAAQPKRPQPRKQPSPPPPRPRAALELPGSGGSFLPPAPVAASSSSRQPPAPSIPPALPAAQLIVEEPVVAPIPIQVPSDSEEDDDDWDEVPAAPPAPAGVSHSITMIEETPGQDHMDQDQDNENEGGEEIDMDEFADLMNQELEEDGGNIELPVEDQEDDDFNIFPDSPEPQHQDLPMPLPSAGAGPISLNAYVGGGGVVDEEEDYSSSDESDED